MEDPLLWSVDRSWGNVRANQDGSPFPSARTKYHVDRGDSTAKCSRHILLNSIDNTRPIGFGGEIYPDQPIGRVSEVEAHSQDLICRRCVPKQPEHNMWSWGCTVPQDERPNGDGLSVFAVCPICEPKERR